MVVVSNLEVKYIGTCPWMEDAECIANLGHINGRTIVTIKTPFNNVIWTYWYLEEFYKEWAVLSIM